MKKIYSKIDPMLLLHIIVDRSDFIEPRIDITEPSCFLQVALMRVDEGKLFRPHRHIDKEVTFKTTKTQESWVITRGVIRIYMYDIDDKLIADEIMGEGGLFLSLNGGHTFCALEDNTFVYELKSGPYEGQAKDKVFI